MTRLEQRDRRARLAREASSWAPPAQKRRPVFVPQAGGRKRKRPSEPCLCASCCALDPARIAIKARLCAGFRYFLRTSNTPPRVPA
jgi:hypothetical protein